MSRPIIAKIFPSSIAHNIDILKNKAYTAKLFAVLKANAYGHGIHNIYSGLTNADGIAVLDLEEAILVRQLGWQKPILLLEGFFEFNDLQIIDEYNLTTSIHSKYQIQLLDEWHTKFNHRNKKINVFLKCNTGMNRLGFDINEYNKIYVEIKNKAWIGQITHMTHYAKADIQQIGIEKQIEIFNKLVSKLPEDKSTSNSAAILWHKQAHYNWVRAGISLYGASPSGVYKDIKTINLKLSMHLHSKLIGIQNIKCGQEVGYGGRFIANQDMKIGIVACGYADGYPRHASDGTPIIVDNIKTRIIGKVSMDMITVDLDNVPQAKIGSNVELWGDSLHIDEVAIYCGTIGYELMCAITPRVKKEIYNVI
jgi:alanine racemase